MDTEGPKKGVRAWFQVSTTFLSNVILKNTFLVLDTTPQGSSSPSSRRLRQLRVGSIDADRPTKGG